MKELTKIVVNDTEYYEKKEAAEYVNRSEHALNKMKSRFNTIKIGGTLLFPVFELDVYSKYKKMKFG